MAQAGFDANFDWNDVKLFLQIAKKGTLTAAANTLGLSQSTASRKLKNLEQAVGRPLFQWDGIRYRLTDEGEVMHLHSERMEEEALSLGRRLMGVDHDIEGVVKLTCTDWFSHYVVARPVAQFVIANPSVTVEIVADPRLLDLRRREADIALRFVPFSDPSIIQRRFADVAYGLYASDGYLDHFGHLDTSNGGDGHQLVMLDSTLDSAADVSWLSKLWPKARPSLRSNNRESQAEACVQGAGVAVLPQVIGDRFALQHLTEYSPPGRVVYLGYHSDLKPLRRLRALIDFLSSSIPRQI